MADKKQYPNLTGIGFDNNSLDLNESLEDRQKQLQGNIGGGPVTELPEPTQVESKPVNAEGFIDDLKNSLGKTQHKPNAQTQANISLKDIPDDAKDRYKNYLPGYNNEDIAGRGQGFLEKLKNGTAKALGTVGTTVVGSTAGVLYGLDKFARSGNFSDFYKNDFTESLDNWSKEMENKFPHYETDKQKDSFFMFTENFWTNKFLNVLGFAGGMALSGGAWGKALSGAGYMLGEMSPALGKIVSAGKMAEAANAAEEAMANLPESERLSSLANSYKNIANKYINRVDLLNKANRVLIPTVANLGISSSMASSMATDFKKKLIEDFKSKNNVEPSAQDLEKIEKTTANAARWMFGLSMAAGTLSFHGMFNKLLNPSESSAILESGINKLEQKEGGEIIEKSSLAQDILGGSNLGRKVLGASKLAGKVFSIPSAMGMVEFSALEPAVQGYYTKQYSKGDASFLADGFGEGLKKVFSKDGIEQFVLGGLMGVTETRSKFREEGEKSTKTKTAVDQLNDVYKNSYLQESLKSLKAGQVIAQEKQQADANNDEEASKSYERQYIDNYLMPHIKWGMKSLVDENLDMYTKLASTDEGVAQLKADGVMSTDTKKEDFQRHVEKLQDIANTMDKEYKALVMRYGKDPRYSDSVMSQMLESSSMSDHYAERLKDLSSRIKTVGIDMEPLFNSIDRKDNKSYSRLKAEILNKASNLKIDGIEAKSEIKDNAKRYIDDTINLYIERKKQIRKYEDIKNNPEGYHIENANPISTPSSTSNSKKKASDVMNETLNLKTKDAPQGEDLEIGVEYYAGSKITPGKSTTGKVGGFKDFSRFTILGKEGDNIRIKTDEGIEHLVPENAFRKYKLGKVEDVEGNKKAKFFMQNINSEYEFNFGKGRKRSGRLEYSPKEGILEFIYKDEKGDTKRMEVTSDQFVARDGYAEPRLKKVGDIKELTEEEKAYFASKEDEKRRDILTKRKIEVLQTLVESKKDKLKEIEDQILDHEIKLEKHTENLKSLREEIESSKIGKDITPARRTNSFKKALRSLFGLSSDLSKSTSETEDSLKDLYSQREGLQDEISILEDTMANAYFLPDGPELIKFLRDGKKNLEDTILETGKSINDLSNLLDHEKSSLKRIISTVLDYIDTFESLYPDAPHSDDNALKEFINKENQYAKDQDITGYFETNPDFFSNLRNLKEIIAQAEEIDIPIKEKDIKEIEDEINKLYDILKETGDRLKLQNEIGNAFLDKLREWKKKEARKRLFETTEARNGLISLQISLNSVSGGGDGTNPPVEDYDKVKDFWEDPKKDITNGLATSVDPTYNPADVNPNSFPNQHNFWARRHVDFLNNLNVLEENIKDGIVSPSSIKVIPISFNNQSNHGFSEFIPDNYLPYGETDKSKAIDNKTNHEKGAIALVYAHQDSDGNFWTIDKNGKKLTKFDKDSKHDMNSAVFTYMENANLFRTGKEKAGETKFNNKEGFDETQRKEILEKGIAARKALLLSTDLKPYEFSVSRGIPNEKKYTSGENKGKTIVMNNPVIHSGLIKPEQLGTGVIMVPTRKISGITSIDDKANTAFITVGEENIKMPLGRPVLKNGSSMVFLNNKQFTPKEASHLFKVLKAMANRMIKNYEVTGSFKVDPEFTEYLSGVLHFNDRVSGDSPKRNQIFFDRDGNLVLGKNKLSVTPDSIEANELLITTFLENGFHNVNNYKLSKIGKEPFNEIVDIDKEGKPIYISWKSYEHYLLSDKYDLDKDRTEEDLYKKYDQKDRTKGDNILPLTTNIIKTVDEKGKPITDEKGLQEPPLIQKYIALKDYADLKPTIKIKEEPKSLDNKANVDTKTISALKDKVNSSTDVTSVIDKAFKEGIVDEKEYQTWQSTLDPDSLEKDLEKLLGEVTNEKQVANIVSKYLLPKFIDYKLGNVTPMIETPKFINDGKTENTVSVEKGDIKFTVDDKGNIEIKSAFGKEVTEELKKAKPEAIKAFNDIVKKELDKEPTVKKEELKETQPKTQIEEKTDNTKDSVVEENRTIDSDIDKKLAEAQEKFKDIPKSNTLFDERRILDHEPIGGIENVEEVSKFIADTTPQITFQDLPHVIKTGNGNFAWGVYRDQLIQIYNQAPKGTGYHEHFHAVWNSFLSNREQQDLYNEFRDRAGIFVDRVSGNIIKYKDATNKQIREAIAEEFKEYKNNNPEYTKPSKVTNFFRRLVNFIKHFVFGNPESIEGLFKKINSSYYREHEVLTRSNLDPEYSEMKGISENTKKDIVHGLGESIVRSLRIDDGSLIRLGEGKLNVRDLFDSLFKKLKNYYEDPTLEGGVYYQHVTGEINKDQLRSTLEAWNYIKENRNDVVKDMLSFLRKHKIIFKNDKTELIQREKEEQAVLQQEDEEGPDTNEVITTSDDLVIEYIDERDSREYDRDTLKLDAKRNAPIEIKVLFDFLTKANYDGYNESLQAPKEDLSPLRLPQLVGSNEYFYKVLDNLAGVTGLQNMQTRLKELAKKEPVLVRLYKSLFEKNANNRNVNQWKLLFKFEKTFAKQKPEYTIQVIDEDGKSYSIDSNLAKDANLMVEDWESTTRGRVDDKSGLVFVDPKGYYRFNTGKIKNTPQDKNSVTAFLKEIGMPIQDSTFDKLRNLNDREELVKRAGALYSQMESKELGIKNKLVNKKSLGVETHLRKIAELLIKAHGVSNPAQHINIDKESVQNYILPNYVSNILNRINQAVSVDTLLSKLPYLKNDVWCSNSRLLKKGGVLFDNNGKSKYNIVPVITEGLINENENNPRTANSRMNRLVRHMQQFNMNLGANGTGVFYNLIPADSKTEWGIRVGHYITIGDFKSNNFKTLAENIFKDYLKSEVNLIRDGISGNRILTDQVKANDNYKKLRFFKDILSKDLVKKVTDFANDLNSNQSLEDFISSIKSDFSKDLWDYVDKLTKQERDYLNDSRVIQTNGRFGEYNKEKGEYDENYNFFGLNTDFSNDMGLNSYDHNGRKEFTSKDIDNIIKFRLLNLMIHNTELHKVFFGDPAEYKDSSKRIKLFTSGTEFTHIDDGDPEGFNKWANTNLNKVGDVNLKMGDIGYHTSSDSLSAMTVDHGDSSHTTIVSSEYEDIKEAIGEELAKAYEQVNEFDAQGIMLDTYWREYQMKSGAAWEQSHEEQHQYDMALARKDRDESGKNKYSSKELKEEDERIIAKGNPEVRGMATPLKPKGAGIMDNDNQMIPFSIKNSIIRLSYPLAKARGMEDLYWFMHENHIGLLGPKSHQKFGRIANLPELYDKETGKITLGKLSKEEINRIKFNIPFEHFSKIVETSAEHDSQTIGTQLRSLANLDSFDNGLPIDFYDRNNKDHNYDEKVLDWANKSEEQKEKESYRYKLYKDNDRALTELSNKGYASTLENLGITEKDGNYEFSDPQKIADFLISEVTRRDLPDNIAEAIQVSFDPSTGKDELVYPLEALPNYQQLKQIIWSKVDKNIIRPKLNGGPKILVSSTMFEKNNREAVYKKDGKWTKVEDYKKLTKEEKKTVRLTSSELKFYTRRGKEGRTTVMEVYLPNIFREKLKQSGSDKTDKEILDYLNSTEEGQRLLKGVGFRIPTQGLNSVDAFIIKDFLPQEMGDSIVVPSEITAKVGSDFDIDKLNTYLRNFYVGTNGFPKAHEFIENANTEDNLKKIYERKYRKELKTGRVVENLINALFKINADKIPSLEEFIEQNKDKSDWELNSKEAVENKYFDTLEDILTLPENFARLVTPNSSKEMVDIEKEISAIKNPEEVGRAKGDINYSNLLNPIWLTNERQTFLDSKGLVGIPASANISHALSQTNPIYIDDNVTLSSRDKEFVNNTEIFLDHPKTMILGKLRTSFSNLKDSVGRYISDKISQYINGAVDAANDPWLMRVLSHKDLISVALFLDRIGISAKDTFFFINQPSIQDFIKEQDIQKAVSGLNPDVEFQFTSDLLQSIKEKYPTNKDYGYTTSNFSYKDMKVMMEKKAKGQELTDKENGIQKQILDEYVKYKIFADHLFQIQNGTSWANMNKPNDVGITLKELALDFARKNNVVNNPDNVLKDNFHGNIREKALNMKDALATVFKTQVDKVQKELRTVIKTFGNYDIRMKADDRKAVIEKANLSIIDYSLQNFIKIGDKELNRYIVPLLINNETHLGKLLNDTKKSVKGDLAANLALKGLQTYYRIKANDIKTIQLENRPNDAFTSNSLTDSLRELRDNPITNRLYNNLVLAGLLQNGVKDSRVSFNKYIPHEDHERFVKPAIDAMVNDLNNLEGFHKNNAFFRNNWQDDKIVPKVRKINSYIPGYGSIKVTPYFKLTEALRKISPSENYFLSLHELSNNSKYPVVKVSEIGVDPETKEQYSKDAISKMKASGDNSYFQTKLFQRVEEFSGEYDSFGNEIMSPVIAEITKRGTRYLYKQINAWGDGANFQEYYPDNRTSVLDRNVKVNEIPDDKIIEALRGSKVEGQEKNLPTDNKPLTNEDEPQSGSGC